MLGEAGVRLQAQFRTLDLDPDFPLPVRVGPSRVADHDWAASGQQHACSLRLLQAPSLPQCRKTNSATWHSTSRCSGTGAPAGARTYSGSLNRC